MSANGTEGPDSVKVIRDGVLIKKSLEGGDESPVPRVRLDLVSKREDPIELSFEDPLPEGVSAQEAVVEGSGKEGYTVVGPHRLGFQLRLSPGTDHLTHYTVPKPPDGVDGLLLAPEITAVEPVKEGRSPSEEATETASPEEANARSGGLGGLKGLLFRSERKSASEQSTVGEEETNPAANDIGVVELPPVRTAVGDVTVCRELTIERNGILGTITISVDGSDRRTVRVVDRCLTDLGTREIGFHPDYEPPVGQVSDGAVRFADTIEGGNSSTIKYGATLWREDDRISLQRIQSNRPPQFEVLSDAVSSDEVSLAGLFGVPFEDESVPTDPVEDLVHALENGSVNEDDLEIIRDALGVGRVPGSLSARMTHLESRTAEFSAYAESLQEFLDEYGSLKSAFDGLRTDYADLEETVRTGEDHRSQIENRVQRIAGEVGRVDESMNNRIRTVLDRIEALESAHDGDIEELESELAELRTALEGLQEAVEAEQDRWRTLADVIN